MMRKVDRLPCIPLGKSTRKPPTINMVHLEPAAINLDESRHFRITELPRNCNSYA